MVARRAHRFLAVAVALLVGSADAGASGGGPTDHGARVYYFEFEVQRVAGIPEARIESYGCVYQADSRDLMKIFEAARPVDETYQAGDVRAKIVMSQGTRYVDARGITMTGSGAVQLDKAAFSRVLRLDRSQPCPRRPIGRDARPAMDPLIRQLSSRLERTSADAVNRYLDDNFEKTVPRLRTLVWDCNPEALALTVKLLNSSNASATQGNSAMLELAMGRCPERLLPMVPTARVKGLCAVEAFADNRRPGEVAPTQLLQEIDRRVRYLRVRDAVANSENGRVCLAAYEEARRELANDE